MTITLQRKLELAGALARMQPLLQRLRLVEEPKKRRRPGALVLVGTAVVAGTVVAGVVCRSRCFRGDAVADPEPDRERAAATGTHESEEVGASGPE